MLRSFFISLSESTSLRGLAERSSFGQRLSSRFVAGTGVEDALRAAQAVNQSGLSVSVDNLGENVTNADEARASAQLYHQMLDEISRRQLNANISLKLTHMGLDVDEQLARDLVSGWWKKLPAFSREILCVWTWKARPTPSALSILCMSCTANRAMPGLLVR